MAKHQTQFACQSCGYASGKWLGRCPDCGSWETFVEEHRAPETHDRASRPGPASVAGSGVPVPYAQITTEDSPRILTGVGELDRVLGGGVVPGSLVLLGGEPGIGKSTLLLQAAGAMARGDRPVLYVSGEESERQVKLRGERLGVDAPGLYIFPEIHMGQVEHHARRMNPALLVVDSIQTVFSDALESAPGSIGQIRECATRLLYLAKSTGIAVFLIGHINKEGAIAGPKSLEHIVDAVLYFEGERHQHHRIVRAVKNRFGASGEVAIFEMTGEGLRDVGNPSALLLAERPTDSPGAAVACAMEGSRPILVEAQALVSLSQFTSGRRMTQGFDRNRLSLLLAMLERTAGLNILGADVYLNIAGGIHVGEPAADLGVVAAVASSFRNRPLPADTVWFGEVGLSGEVRAVPQAALRAREAAAMGFRKLVVPSACAGSVAAAGLETVAVRGVNEMLDLLF